MNKRSDLLLALGMVLGCALLVTSCAKPDAGTTCTGGLESCGSTCVDQTTDHSNCGACGMACSSTQTCTNSKCVCQTGYLLCGTTCVPSDASNCGTCGTKCTGTTNVCSGGTCGATCSGGATMCTGGACVDTTNATLHCGSCTNACRPDQVCIASACACPSGQTVCNGVCLAGTCGGGTGGASGGVGGMTGGTGGTTGGTGGTTGGTGGMTGGTGGRTGGVGGTTGGTGGMTGGTGGTTGTGGAGGSNGSCTNTNTSVINEDSSGFVCNNTWGIQGAWYCYSDGADSSISCKGSDGKGAGAIPWNSSSNAMCLSGTIGTGSGSYAGIGFKVNSGPPGSTATPGTWDASKIVGFAITLVPGASGKGSGGMILNLEYPTSTDLDSQTKDAPGITVPGVATSGSITYNALFADSVLANNINNRHNVDPANLTDVKIAFFPDSTSHSYDFCIKSVVPLMSKPNPVVATGNYGPTWTNQTAQAVNGINGYAVQSAPFSMTGLPMSMQVLATSGGVGFTYTAKQGASGNSPAAFPAIISGWGPGEAGIQLYGPYQADKTISALTSVKSSWTFSPGSSGDSAYDIWLGTSKAPTTAPAVELMVWLNNGGKQPLGNTKASTAVTGSDGVARFANTGQANSTGQQVVSYVPTSGSATSVTNLDLLQYLKDAVANGYAGLNKDATKVYLLGVQAGFEVYSADTWKTTDYNITIN